MQISELLCRAEYIMRATAAPSVSPLSSLTNLPPLPTLRLVPALDEMLQLSAPPAYPRQLHFAINLRYRTCDRIRSGSRETARRQTYSLKLADAACVVTSRCQRVRARAKSISKENIICRARKALNSVVNKRFNLLSAIM